MRGPDHGGQGGRSSVVAVVVARAEYACACAVLWKEGRRGSDLCSSGVCWLAGGGARSILPRNSLSRECGPEAEAEAEAKARGRAERVEGGNERMEKETGLTRRVPPSPIFSSAHTPSPRLLLPSVFATHPRHSVCTFTVFNVSLHISYSCSLCFQPMLSPSPQAAYPPHLHGTHSHHSRSPEAVRECSVSIVYPGLSAMRNLFCPLSLFPTSSLSSSTRTPLKYLYKAHR